MEESKIYFKYDGESESIKNHQLDVHILSSALDNISDLIKAADSSLSGKASSIQIKAQAGFVQGSFGVELIVLADPVVLEALGVIASGIAGSAFAILQKLKGEKIDEIIIDEDSEIAEIISAKGETTPVPKPVAKILGDDVVRKKIDGLVYDPISSEDVGSFSIYSDLEDLKPIVEVTKESSSYYKKPSKPKTHTITELETKATIEFKTANKESGTSGWRMLHLGEESAVKVEDEEFLAAIKRPKAPSIFGEKFKVKMITKTTQKAEQEPKKTYRITHIIGTLRN